MANTFIKVISFLCILLFNVIDGQKINPSTVCAKCPYDNNYILGVIVFSVLVTIAIVFLTLVLIYFLNRIKLINIGYIIGSSGKQTEEASLTKNDLVAKDVENGHDYAFDNPYFKDDDSGMTLRSHMGNDRMNYRAQDTNGALFQLPLNCTTEQKQLSLPNIKKREQVTVALTGHDFTGLGFNICGNMRDGIFIKDVLTRGPANESGLVKAGDRIMCVTVSFEKMVYEDALTILSYASPYDVKLKIEKNPPKPTPNLSHNLVSSRRSAANEYSNRSNQRLLHPLFRSHSVEELTYFAKQQHQPALTKSFGSSKSHGIMKKIKTQLLNARSSLGSLSTTSAKSKLSSKDSPPRLHGKVLESSQQSSFTEVYTNEAACERLNSTSQKILSQKAQISEPLHTGDISLELHSRSPLKEESGSDIKPTSMKGRIDSPLKSLETSHSVCTSRNYDPPQPVPRKLPLNKRKAPMPPEQITLSPILQNDKATMRHDSDRKSTPSPSKPIETMAVVHYEQTPSEENLPSITDQQLSSITIKDFSHVTDSDLRDVEREAAIQPSLAPSSTNAKFKSCSLSDLSRDRQKRSNRNQSFPERAVSLDFKSKAFPEENFTSHVAKSDDSEDMVHWETKPYIIHSDSISTAYSSDFISDSTNRNIKQTHETYPSVEESLCDNPDSLNCPTSLEANDATSSQSAHNSSISPECAESGHEMSSKVEGALITSSSNSKEDSFTQIIPETAEESMITEPQTSSGPQFSHRPVITSTLSHVSSNLLKKNDKLDGIVTNGKDHGTTINSFEGQRKGSVDKLMELSEADSHPEKNGFSKKIPSESPKSTEKSDLDLNYPIPGLLSKKNGQKSESNKLHSRPATYSDENFSRNSRIRIEPSVSTVNVRSLEDDNDNGTPIDEIHQFSAKEQKLIQKKELDPQSKKNSTPIMPMASASSSSALPMISRLYYINSPTLIPMVAHNDEANDFESWSYVSEKGDKSSPEGSNIPSPSNSPSELRFKTSFEVPSLRDDSETAKNKVPEITGVTSEKASQESSSNPRTHEAADQSKF